MGVDICGIGFCFGEYDKKVCWDCLCEKDCVEMIREEMAEHEDTKEHQDRVSQSSD